MTETEIRGECWARRNKWVKIEGHIGRFFVHTGNINKRGKVLVTGWTGTGWVDAQAVARSSITKEQNP